MSYGNAKKILRDAVAGGYGVAAFNINSLDSVIATIGGAEKENMPIFLQVHGTCEAYVEDVEAYLKVLDIYIKKSSVDIVLHHDHCNTLEEINKAVDRGFSSVMFDGSALPFEDNVAQTARAAEYAHQHGVLLEAELGSIPSMEATGFSEGDRLTNPELVKQFIAETNCDMLAISVGTAHGGVRCDTHLPLYFERLKKIHDLAPDYPFVLHGGASMPKRLIDGINAYGGAVEEQMHICSEEDIARACTMGIGKVNMDVDNWLAFTTGVRKSLLERPEVYEPMSYLKAGRRNWEGEVRHKIRNLKKYADCV